MSRSWVIIPAAGLSRRMGRPKLLLPWNQWTLIDQVLFAWTGSDVDEIVVVLRDDDGPLRDACGRWPVHQVRVQQTPPDMKASVNFGRRFLETHWRPVKEDRCFVAPADLPELTVDIINRLLNEPFDPSTVTVPHFGDRQGHPVLLPWDILAKIDDLADDEGLNQLVSQHPQHVVTFAAEDYFGDVDTPQEYEQLREKRSHDRADG